MTLKAEVRELKGGSCRYGDPEMAVSISDGTPARVILL
jgi:hypothetical protein